MEAMFIQASLELPVPADTAVRRLYPAVHDSAFEDLSEQAYEAGMHALVKVGPLGEAPLLSKTVRLELLEPHAVPGGARVPLRWEATGATGHLFPVLDADLDIAAVDEHRCTLSINAVYTPPLGALGAGIDRLVLSRAARATMRSLLRGLADALSRPSESAGTPPPAKPGEITFAI
jgi:hypothetical protein